MTVQFEVREFRNVKFSGADIVRLIKENELEDFEIESFKTEHTGLGSHGLSVINPYVDVLKFRRRVE